MIKFAICIPFR